MVDATSSRRVDVDAPVTPSAETRTEPTHVKVLPLISDSHGVCVCDMSFRCLLRDTVYTIAPNTPQQKQISLAKGDLDPINKSLTVAIRIRRRLQDGTYKFVRSFNTSHAEQVPRKQVVDAASGSTYWKVGGRVLSNYSRMKCVVAFNEAGEQAEIIDPTAESYIVLNAMCRAADWPNPPADDGSSGSMATAPANVDNESSTGDELDDMPT